MDKKILYSTSDLIKILSMSKTTILKSIKNNMITPLKYGNKFYFTQEAVDEFINKIREGKDE